MSLSHRQMASRPAQARLGGSTPASAGRFYAECPQSGWSPGDAVGAMAVLRDPPTIKARTTEWFKLQVVERLAASSNFQVEPPQLRAHKEDDHPSDGHKDPEG